MRVAFVLNQEVMSEKDIFILSDYIKESKEESIVMIDDSLNHPELEKIITLFSEQDKEIFIETDLNISEDIFNKIVFYSNTFKVKVIYKDNARTPKVKDYLKTLSFNNVLAKGIFELNANIKQTLAFMAKYGIKDVIWHQLSTTSCEAFKVFIPYIEEMVDAVEALDLNIERLGANIPYCQLSDELFRRLLVVCPKFIGNNKVAARTFINPTLKFDSHNFEMRPDVAIQIGGKDKAIFFIEQALNEEFFSPVSEDCFACPVYKRAEINCLF